MSAEDNALTTVPRACMYVAKALQLHVQGRKLHMRRKGHSMHRASTEDQLHDSPSAAW